MRILRTETARVFQPLLQARNARYLGAWGGRGSGKSHFFAEHLVRRALSQPGFRAVCCREIQKSIRFSARQLIADKISRLGVSASFGVQEQLIRTPGDGMIIFQGLQDHTADSVKSLEGVDVAWLEEAQSVGARSWRLLRPTIMRNEGAQIWASWNPETPDGPVDGFFRNRAPTDERVACVQAVWRDNPWFSENMEAERRDDLARLDPAEYAHIWEGAYLALSEALIFRDRVTYEGVFTPPSDARLYYGIDWGFATDPTALVRCWIDRDVLYVDYAEGAPGIELDDLPALIDSVPGARTWPLKGDGARPETISYLRNRCGIDIKAAAKWPGSVEDGVARLKGFARICVHERAEKIAREFRTYSYKVDKRTGDILPKIEDAHNHWIDALRYALDGVIVSKRRLPDFSAFAR